MAKYILFDFDGTLADSKAVFINLYNDLARKRAYRKMTAENLEALRGMSIPERCRQLGVPMYKMPFIAAAIMKKYKKAVTQIDFNPGIKQVLQELNDKRLPFAILTSNSKENIEAFFVHHRLPCPEIFSSSRIFGKDRLLKKFMKAKNTGPSDILYIGDELRDIEACRKCSVPVAWVSWGYDSEEAIVNLPPDFILHKPDEILDLLITV